MEKKYGTIKIDYAGRLVIPAKLRKIMELENGGFFEISADEDRIILVKRKEACIICGATGVEFRVRNEKCICINCCNTL